MPDIIYQDSYQYLTRCCLNITDACNLQCKYCFVEQHPHYMTLRTAQDAVQWLLKNRELKQDNKNIFVNFFGGEPTLLWDELIVPLVEWVRNNQFPISFGMTTNGTLLNEDRLKWMKDNQLGMLLSIDGDQPTQSYNRPCRNDQNSFELVSKNIPLILKYYPGVTFRATIYKDTVQNLFNDYCFAMRQGFKNVFFTPDERHSWPQDKIDILREELSKIFSYMSLCFNNNTLPIHWSTINETFRNILRMDLDAYNNIDITQYPKNIKRCGLGITMGAIGYDGTIYGCQEQVSPDMKSIFYIGDIYNGIDKNKHLNLLTKYSETLNNECENKDLCINCELKSLCKNRVCPSTALDITGHFNIATELHCLWNRWLYINCLLLMRNMVENNNQTFNNYLNDWCGYKRKEEVE